MADKQSGPLLLRHQAVLFRELASRMAGAEYVDRMWRQLEPVFRNKIGHGEPLQPTIVGDADDPKNNYWKGVWQVYRAE